MDGVQLLLATLGWCSLINLGMLMVASVVLVFCNGSIRQIHQRWFGLSDEDLQREYFRYLATYKIITLVFNVVPYVSLRIALG